MTYRDLTDADDAFLRYEEIRHRLPAAVFPARADLADTLGDVADRWDGFVLDAFGVLNVGDAPIPGAVDRMARLRELGKRLCVLTNAASYPRAEALRKYRRLGFDFAENEVVSSRDIAIANLARIAPGAHWGAIAQAGDDFADIPARVTDLATQKDWSQVDGFLLLSSAQWSPTTADALTRAMRDHPRPLVVANPDLVAPREGGLTIEPGHHAHHLCDLLDVPVFWFGKPFAHGFAAAAALTGLPADRLCMVGDTLHTDVLGGRAAGMGTVLVARHGLFAGRDVNHYIRASGIVPDVVVTTT